MTLASVHDDREGRRVWARETSVALDTLDPISATALRLIYQRHTTPAQTAAHLGLAQTEVKTLVARGLQRLAAGIGRSLDVS